MPKVPAEIFKAYDIRGIVDRTLTEPVCRLVGRALGTYARELDQKRMAMGRDGRLSAPQLSRALAQGVQESGVHVIDIGEVATPMLYFATHYLQTGCGVMITGSHNPPAYNGLKMMVGGQTLAGDAIQSLRERIETDCLASGSGDYAKTDIAEAYFARITDDVKLKRALDIVVDCGNGVAGAYAPELYRRLGCTVRELYCEVDGNFPNHHPDPSQPANLRDLIHALAQGDGELGLAFDGDGDRLGVITKAGNIIYPDRQLMLFAADVLSRHPGAQVIFDVKSTRNLFAWIRNHGGEPVLWKTGHSLIKAKMRETGALLAGEMSGHMFFKERWFGFDDGLYAGARLLEILSAVPDVGAAFAALPDSVNTPELQLALEEGENYALIKRLKQSARFDGAREIIDIDGLRVEYDDGFGLARASNTTPVVVLRFEADDVQALARIQNDFRRVLKEARPHTELPF